MLQLEGCGPIPTPLSRCRLVPQCEGLLHAESVYEQEHWEEEEEEGEEPPATAHHHTHTMLGPCV